MRRSRRGSPVASPRDWSIQRVFGRDHFDAAKSLILGDAKLGWHRAIVTAANNILSSQSCRSGSPNKTADGEWLSSPSLRSTDQFCRLDTQRLRELYQDLNRRVTRTAFNVANVRTVDPSLKSIFLLAPAFGAAQALQVSAQSFANIHLRCIASMSTINLQTIRDIRLDCTA